jgi:hypothetical protein
MYFFSCAIETSSRRDHLKKERMGGRVKKVNGGAEGFQAICIQGNSADYRVGKRSFVSNSEKPL